MHVLSNARRRAVLCLIMLMLACLPAMALAGYASREVELSDEGLSVPPLYQDWTYKLYHSGPAVTVLKERLQTLGYFQQRTGFGDKFDEKLQSRLIKFQRSNGLPETGCADAQTVSVLFGDDAVKGFWYVGDDAEPDTAVIIPVTRSVHWYKSARDQIGARIALCNISSKKTVTAFEISMYTEDEQGNRLHETGNIVKLCKLEPYCEMWSDYAYFDGVENIHALYAALHRVRYADGTYEIFENAPYERWILDNP